MGGPVSALPEARAGHPEIFCALALVWLFGFALMLALWFRKRLKVSPALKEITDARSERILQSLERVRARLGMKRRVRVALSPEAIEPGIWRVWRPILALPSDLPDHLSDEELDAMLTHELVHISRWDNLTSSFEHDGLLHLLVSSAGLDHRPAVALGARMLVRRESAGTRRVVAGLRGEPLEGAAILRRLEGRGSVHGHGLELTKASRPHT